MTNFIDSEYATLIGHLLHDTRYIEISNMGKMAGLRKHAEVLVRKILDIGNDSMLTLGEVRNKSKNKFVKDGMIALGEELSCRLIEITNRINPLGSAGTHTQHTDNFSDEEIAQVEDAILDLYAMIFIKFFVKYPIGLDFSPVILREFSILPPIIRFKTWSYLYDKDKKNVQVVNKLCLSIIKTFDKQTAYKWLKENSKDIKEIPYPTDSEIEQYVLSRAVEVAPGQYAISLDLDIDQYDNIYDLLYAKINDKRTSINESGKLYSTFEGALEHYNKHGKMDVLYASEEEIEFFSLMEFVYIGRQPIEKEM